MMMGLGFFVMLAVLAVPILLLVGLVALLFKPKDLQGDPRIAISGAPTELSLTAAGCTHCGAKLRREWVHCPQCGAPTEDRP